jgi:SHS family lactate transporter-like MFS transporter
MVHFPPMNTDPSPVTVSAASPASSPIPALPLDYSSEAPVSTRDATSAVLAGFLGWTLDAFDFFLVVMMLPQIAKDLKVGNGAIAASLTITLAFRPVGAFIFGLLADRYGRRLPMIIDLVFYSIVEVATGFAPNIVVFLVLRALFGIGMGGEWGVGASLAMEKVPPKWRGVISGLLQEGYAAGYLLAAVAYGLIYPRIHDWRPLFWLGGLPALVALFIRFGVKESKVWEKTKAESWSNLGRGIVSNWKLWLYLVALMTMMNFSSHGTQDLFPTFLQVTHHQSPQTKSWVTAISMCGAIVGGVVFGLASDKFGRRWTMVAALAGALLVIPLWAFSSSLAMITVGAVLMQFMVQGAWGVVPAHITELSPDNVRGFLPGFAYQCGALIAGTAPYIQETVAQGVGIAKARQLLGHVAPSIQETVAHGIGYPKAMAGMGVLIFTVAAVVTALGRERKALRFG